MAVDEVDAFDLYACFPSSIEVARDSLGLAADDHRPLTLTGGLQYHGGPGSNYVTHSVANTLDWLRAGHGEVAMVHGNGYFLTKQSVGRLHAAAPPADAPTPPVGLQERIDAASTTVPVDASVTGAGTIVAYTVAYDRDGAPESGVMVVDVGDDAGGHRHSVARTDAATGAALVADDAVGAAVTLSTTPEGNVAVLA